MTGQGSTLAGPRPRGHQLVIGQATFESCWADWLTTFYEFESFKSTKNHLKGIDYNASF